MGDFRQAKNRGSVELWGRCGHLGGQMGETAQMGHFLAKSLCYSPRFWGWAWGLGNFRPKINLGIPSRSKIDLGLPGRLRSGEAWAFRVDGAVWMVKQTKQREQAIIRPNRQDEERGSVGFYGQRGRISGQTGETMLMDHFSNKLIWGGLRAQACFGPKINQGLPYRLRSDREEETDDYYSRRSAARHLFEEDLEMVEKRITNTKKRDTPRQTSLPASKRSRRPVNFDDGEKESSEYETEEEEERPPPCRKSIQEEEPEYEEEQERGRGEEEEAYEESEEGATSTVTAATLIIVVTQQLIVVDAAITVAAAAITVAAAAIIVVAEPTLVVAEFAKLFLH
ncbi:hypothetical protein FXO38_31913 [Capsicum annuum]|nr:hypothetical protein FXO38_31913 [Capsicum annuum]